MPSILSFVESFHKLVCKEIESAITTMREQGHEIYPPTQITYNYKDEYEFTMPYENIKKAETPLATLDVMEHNSGHRKEEQ